MTFQEWLRLQWEMMWGNVERLSIIVDGNQVDAFLLKPTKNIRNKGIVYLHGGTFDLEQNMLNRFSDAFSYRTMGYHVLLLKFPDEDFPVAPNPNSDVIEIRDAYHMIAPLMRDSLPHSGMTMVGMEINIITVSRGGYCGLLAFKDQHPLYNKIVCFVPPLNPDNLQWFNQQADWAKKYLSQCKSPVYHAHRGAYLGLENRMLMIGGQLDTLCPPSINSQYFASLTGCKSYIVKGYGHNASDSTAGRTQAMEFIAGMI